MKPPKWEKSSLPARGATLPFISRSQDGSKGARRKRSQKVLAEGLSETLGWRNRDAGWPTRPMAAIRCGQAFTLGASHGLPRPKEAGSSHGRKRGEHCGATGFGPSSARLLCAGEPPPAGRSPGALANYLPGVSFLSPALGSCYGGCKTFSSNSTLHRQNIL